MDILSFILSKFGAVITGAIALICMWLYGRHQKAKREEAESRAEVAEVTLEVKHEQAKREEVVDKMDSGDILNYWKSGSGMRHEAGVSPAPTPGKTDPGKSGSGQE